jgi:hypothetical protein
MFGAGGCPYAFGGPEPGDEPGAGTGAPGAPTEETPGATGATGAGAPAATLGGCGIAPIAWVPVRPVGVGPPKLFGAPPADAAIGLATLCMTCVPGTGFGFAVDASPMSPDDDAGETEETTGLLGVEPAAGGAATTGPPDADAIAALAAPRCDTTLLTASGDTNEGSPDAPAGGPYALLGDAGPVGGPYAFAGFGDVTSSGVGGDTCTGRAGRFTGPGAGAAGDGGSPCIGGGGGPGPRM